MYNYVKQGSKTGILKVLCRREKQAVKTKQRKKNKFCKNDFDMRKNGAIIV